MIRNFCWMFFSIFSQNILLEFFFHYRGDFFFTLNMEPTRLSSFTIVIVKHLKNGFAISTEET